MKSKVAWDRYLGGALVYLLNFVARFLGFLLRRDHAPAARGDITVIKVLGGGSLVMALPALLGIRREYPAFKMRLLTTAMVKPFAETLGVFDEILVLDDGSIVSLAASALRSLRRCYGSDTVIDLEIYSYLSTVLSIFTFARNRFGFFFEETGSRQKLHTHRIFFNPGSPLYRHYDHIATMLEAPIVPTQACSEHVFATLGIVARTVKPSGGRIAIGCGCSELSEERKLSPAQWSRHVFAAAADKDRDVVFLGGASDKREAEKVIAAVRALGSGGWHGTLSNLSGTLSLQDSLRTLAACDEFWGIESSLLHYARLFGLRITAFFGPTHPMRLRPMPWLAETVHYRKTLCSPCIHLVSMPPCHGDNRCMKWLFEPREESRDDEGWLPVVM
ncbi:MAG TPA: glycosyltransferase family 9 protein [Pseudolabrys sp.]|nr:glycosyltransferase family 9 protein [Pseudolabrys sp.]